jgi:hypothetical protein
MIKLYELLAKVGTNPKLRAWAMEQLIKLKHVKPRYKKSYFHEMDLNKVKDIRNPNWQAEKIAKEKAYNLKNKVVDLTKAKDKVRWNKIEKTQDKDKFYGVTGQVNTWLKKIKDEGVAWEAEIAKKDAWFNKLMKAKVKGDPRAIKILNDYFKKQDKDFADKIIPFKPKKAEGGRIGFDDGGPSQKEIDKGIAAIEKLKPGLMPESYEALIEIYRDKQKELDIGIMESAGGLGEMLGEGGRIGMQSGSTPSDKFLKNWYWDGKGPTGSTDGAYIDIESFDEFRLKHGSAIWDRFGPGKAKGGRIGFKKGTKKGGIGDLMGELYRIFEIGPLLGSPELIDLIQKIPFEKGGRVGFKKGDKVDLDRRMILKGIASLAALPIVGKYFKWAKPLKDITVKIRKASWNEDVDYGTSGNILFDFIGKSKVGRELIKKYLPKNYKKDWGMDPKDAYKIVKKAKDKGLNIKVTELADDATTVVKEGVVNPKWYLGGRTLDRQTQQRLYNEAQKRFKKQTSRENIKDHLEDTSFFENDMYRWPKPNYGGTPTRYTDEIIDLIEPVVKKAVGGPVGYPPVQFNPKEQPPVQGPVYETNNPNEAFKEILRQSIGSGITSGNLGGGFSHGIGYGKDKPFDYGIGYNTDPQSSGWNASYGVNQGGDDVMSGAYNSPGGTFSMGVEKQEGSDPQWKFQKKWKFDQGGIARRPNAVPPLSGPMPQGLTFLLGDDIVKNRIT